jgi:UDP-glucose 4-epimerase
LNGKPLHVWGDGTVVRDYIYIDDLTQAFLSAIGTSSQKKILNIGSGSGISINELIDSLRSITKRPFNVNYHPSRKQETPYSVLDISLAKEVLSWSPTVDLKQGLRSTWQWAQTLT